MTAVAGLLTSALETIVGAGSADRAEGGRKREEKPNDRFHFVRAILVEGCNDTVYSSIVICGNIICLNAMNCLSPSLRQPPHDDLLSTCWHRGMDEMLCWLIEQEQTKKRCNVIGRCRLSLEACAQSSAMKHSQEMSNSPVFQLALGDHTGRRMIDVTSSGETINLRACNRFLASYSEDVSTVDGRCFLTRRLDC